MRRNRLRRRKRINPIGYHPDDVKGIIESISLKIKRLEADLNMENEHFAKLLNQKLKLQNHIRELLDQALEKEQLLRDGHHHE